jgi:hypothetical protein
LEFWLQAEAEISKHDTEGKTALRPE